MDGDRREPDYRFSLANAWSGYRRFLATDRAMRSGDPLPAHAAPRVLAAALAAISLAILILLAINQLS